MKLIYHEYQYGYWYFYDMDGNCCSLPYASIVTPDPLTICYFDIETCTVTPTDEHAYWLTLQEYNGEHAYCANNIPKDWYMFPILTAVELLTRHIRVGDKFVYYQHFANGYAKYCVVKTNLDFNRKILVDIEL